MSFLAFFQRIVVGGLLICAVSLSAMAADSAESTALAPQSNPDACARYLNKVAAQSLSALKSEEELLKAVQEDMVNSGLIFSEEEKSTVVAAFRLKPLFDARIAQRAISAQLEERGMKNPKQAQAYLEAFGALSVQEQLGFVNGVIARLNQALPAEMTAENLNDAMAVAKSINMPFKDFADIFKKWSMLRGHGMEEIKLAILIQLLQPSGDLIKQVKSQKTLWQRLRRFMRKDPLYREQKLLAAGPVVVEAAPEEEKWPLTLLPIEVQRMMDNLSNYADAEVTTTSFERILKNYLPKLSTDQFTALVLAGLKESGTYTDTDETYEFFDVVRKGCARVELSAEQLDAIKVAMLDDIKTWTDEEESDNAHELVMSLKGKKSKALPPGDSTTK